MTFNIYSDAEAGSSTDCPVTGCDYHTERPSSMTSHLITDHTVSERLEALLRDRWQ